MGDGDDDAVNVKYYPLLSASALLLRDANGCVEESEEIKTTKASTSSSSGKPSTSSEFDGYAQVTKFYYTVEEDTSFDRAVLG